MIVKGAKMNMRRLRTEDSDGNPTSRPKLGAVAPVDTLFAVRNFIAVDHKHAPYSPPCAPEASFTIIAEGHPPSPLPFQTLAFFSPLLFTRPPFPSLSGPRLCQEGMERRSDRRLEKTPKAAKGRERAGSYNVSWRYPGRWGQRQGPRWGGWWRRWR